ncbi:MAG TPA: outer membrane beta-barrel protein [Gammaproteobacteria bacterium]|nr:outer membrane beta-barrel protein [Gammaproteobacteria bacterium]
MVSLKTVCYSLVSLLFVFPLIGRDVIVEFKGAYFWPTDCTFKKIYHKGGALYGPELTVQLFDDKNWYAFASVDYFQKKGHSIGLCEPTKVRLIPVALGLKYFVPVCDDRIDLYAGLGLEWVNVRTKNCSQAVVSKQSDWGLGGIAKVGAYYHLPHHFLIDTFINYHYAKVGSNDCWCHGFESRKANVSGAIFGVGLGYNF